MEVKIDVKITEPKKEYRPDPKSTGLPVDRGEFVSTDVATTKGTRTYYLPRDVKSLWSYLRLSDLISNGGSTYPKDYRYELTSIRIQDKGDYILIDREKLEGILNKISDDLS